MCTHIYTSSLLILIRQGKCKNHYQNEFKVSRIGNEAITIMWQHPRELTQMKIGSQLKTTTTLTKLIHRDAIRQYWINSQKNCNANDESLIDWKSLNKAARGEESNSVKE